MKRRILFLIVALSLACGVLAGCSGDEPKEASNDTYATQTRTSSLEYSIYMNKQITVFANQVNTRVTAVNSLKRSNYSDEADLAKNCVKILKETRDEVDTTYPSEGQDENRLKTLQVMDTTINDVENYIKDLEDDKDISGYAEVFLNDFNELTGMANLYNR